MQVIPLCCLYKKGVLVASCVRLFWSDAERVSCQSTSIRRWLTKIRNANKERFQFKVGFCDTAVMALAFSKMPKTQHFPGFFGLSK